MLKRRTPLVVSGFKRTDGLAGIVVAVILLSPAIVAASRLPLIDAVKTGDRAAVRALLKDRAHVRAAEPDGTTALHWAVRADDVELMRLLLAAGADASAATRYGITPLQLAAMNGSPTATEMLLEAGASPNAVLPEGETILMTAARTGNAQVIARLLDGGAEIDARERWYGETALMWAAAENHPQAVRQLAERGADVNARSTRLEIARRRSGQSVLPLGHWTPLMYAARQGALEATAALLDARADPDLTDPDGATALVLAIINAHYDVAALLVERGANPNIGDNEAKMAALYAAVDMNTLAVGHGRPNTKASGRLSALDLIERLLTHGADPNATLAAPLMQRHHSGGDRALGQGATPFMRAAKTGDVAAMRLLVTAGAQPSTTLPDGVSALMLAAGLGWRDGSPAAPSFDQGTEDAAVEAIRYCLELGLDINATTTNGDTPLHVAVSGRGSPKIVRYLVERGANLDAKDKRGRTPLDLATASRRERQDLVELLRELAAR
jgi:ankyrin repeat protein